MPVQPALDLGALRSALTEKAAPWRFAYTSMTALTEEERVVRLGVPLPENLDEEQVSLQAEAAEASAKAARAENAGAPVAFDLRNVSGVNYTTPVEDQGGCGSCVAFGTVGVLEHVTRYTRGTPSLPVDLSEAQMFYCWGAAAGANCNTGWMPGPALDAAVNNGVTFADYFPYTAGNQACTVNADWPNHLCKAVSWQNLTNNPAAMKQYISQYGSITACFYVYQDFFSYGGGIYRHVTGGLAGGHCVTLVGYDDNQGCWIAKNSWGTGWGVGGFFEIAYGQCNIEGWAVCGVPGTTLRTWLPNQLILGLWSNEVDDNIWAYGSLRGWLKLDGVATPTAQAMLAELAAAKAKGTMVGLYENAGEVDQLYAW
jgi:C1A family cysteine protease